MLCIGMEGGDIMAFRKKMTSSHSKRNFRSGVHTRRKNVTTKAMRGGYRI